MPGSPDEVMTPEPIPMLDLRSEVEENWDQINDAIQRVLRSGQFVLGPEVDAFEDEVAHYLGVKHAVSVNSGTDALVIGLRSLGVGPGDEVITTPFTFFAATEAILHVGATPVFVDIREDSFNIDPDLIENAVTERTKAILPVHLFGNPAAMTKIVAIARKHDLKILEDAAQSFGAVYHGDSEGDANEPDGSIQGKMTGTIGDAGAFSFYPTKPLGAYGDAGLVATNDDALAERARRLRSHGESPSQRYVSTSLGYNSRLDALQAAILRVKLRLTRQHQERRIEVARAYHALLADHAGVKAPGLRKGHVFHQFVVRLSMATRDHIRDSLASVANTNVYYPVSIATMAPVRAALHYVQEFPVTQAATEEALALPIHPAMRTSDALVVTEALIAEIAQLE